MLISLRTRQVVGVAALVLAAMAILSTVHLQSLARLSLDDAQARGELLARAIYQRAREVVLDEAGAYEALRKDRGIRSLLESSIAYGRGVTYATIVDTDDRIVVHSFPSLEGKRHEPDEPLRTVIARGALARLRAVYADRNFAVEEPILLGDRPFGAIRIGLSTVLIRADLTRALRPVLLAMLVALTVALGLTVLLSRWVLRPIHVISSGLSRLDRGEYEVTLDLPSGDDFASLGESFNAIGARLAERADTSDGRVESAVVDLEDAVAVLDAEGAILFANRAMRATLPPGDPVCCLVDATLRADHPYRRVVAAALAGRHSEGPVRAPVEEPRGAAVDGDPEVASDERLISANVIQGLDGRFVGLMLVAQNVTYLGQVQTTLEYAHRLAALGRPLAGVAHEVKNPLNAMRIHLELLKQKLAVGTDAPGAGGGSILGIKGSADAGTARGGSDVTSARRHLDVLEEEIGRLDEVIQGFVKFMRPPELHPQPVAIADLAREVMTLIAPDAKRAGVVTELDCPASQSTVYADPALLRQALLNLALNACQSMPAGGTLRIRARAETGRRVVVDVEDTGCGIPPDRLERIFELYYTSRANGSGIGLSMVHLVVQLHGGEIDVESTVGAGSRFRLSLPQAYNTVT